MKPLKLSPSFDLKIAISRVTCKWKDPREKLDIASTNNSKQTYVGMYIKIHNKAWDNLILYQRTKTTTML